MATGRTNLHPEMKSIYESRKCPVDPHTQIKLNMEDCNRHAIFYQMVKGLDFVREGSHIVGRYELGL